MNFKLNIQLFGNAVIPFDNGRNDKRDIEGLWLQALATSKALTAAIGCEFGSVLNIQDVGQKEQGKVYLDKNNGKLYKCLNTTTSVSNTTENFALFNVQQNSDRLDNLKIFCGDILLSASIKIGEYVISPSLSVMSNDDLILLVFPNSVPTNDQTNYSAHATISSVGQLREGVSAFIINSIPYLTFKLKGDRLYNNASGSAPYHVGAAGIRIYAIGIKN